MSSVDLSEVSYRASDLIDSYERTVANNNSNDNICDNNNSTFEDDPITDFLGQHQLKLKSSGLERPTLIPSTSFTIPELIK